MNRLLWFALGGAVTLVSGVVYLEMCNEKPCCTSPGLPCGTRYSSDEHELDAYKPGVNVNSNVDTAEDFSFTPSNTGEASSDSDSGTDLEQTGAANA